MKYLITIYGDESAAAGATPEQMAEILAAWGVFTEKVKAAGAFEAGEGLAPSTTATTLRVADGGGDHLVVDGPFAETKEQLGGFYLLDCADLDEAIGWAKQLPMQGGSIEVRPVMDYEGAEAGGQGAEAGATA